MIKAARFIKQGLFWSKNKVYFPDFINLALKSNAIKARFIKQGLFKALFFLQFPQILNIKMLNIYRIVRKGALNYYGSYQ